MEVEWGVPSGTRCTYKQSILNRGVKHNSQSDTRQGARTAVGRKSRDACVCGRFLGALLVGDKCK